jgi:hypothetical protein
MRSLGSMVALATRIDPALRTEVAGLPETFGFRLGVWPAGPHIGMERTSTNTLRMSSVTTTSPDLVIQFKHLAFAESVLFLRESTARAAARDRVVIDGAVDQAMRVQRIIDGSLAKFVPAFVLAMRDRS